MERKDDTPSVSANPGDATHRRHRRGMLALLPDTLQHFPYNYTVWKEGYLDKRAQLLSRTKRQRRRRLYNNSNTETQSSSAHDHDHDDDDVNQETSTDQVFEQATAAALLLVDPYQPYSLQVLDRLIQRLVLPENNHLNHHQQQQQEQQHVHGIILLLLNTSGDDDNVWRIQIEDLLRHTGLSLLSITPQQSSSSSSSSWWPWFQTTLNLYTCPALCVLETRTGRRISVTAEEMALEWNNNNAAAAASAAATEISTTATASCEETTTATTTTTTITSKKDPVLRAWCQGRSALSWSQQARAALTVPSAMPCVLS